jgi:hypothetical protein
VTASLLRIRQSCPSSAFAEAGAFRLGSWALDFYATRAELQSTIVGLFREGVLERVDLRPRDQGLTLYCMHAGFNRSTEALVDAECFGDRTVPPDGFLARRDGATGTVFLRTTAIRAVLMHDGHRSGIYLILDVHALPAHDFAVHLSFVVNRLLFALGRLVLHAGAVSFANRAALLLGERGSGKSTACLGLGVAGATILADDHTLLTRDEGAFHVSGCDGQARVTEHTEAFFLAGQLGVMARDYAGLWKKEFRLGDFFRSDPNRDYPVDHVLFLSIADRFAIRELPRSEATALFIGKIRNALRFNDASDFTEYLDYVASFMSGVRTHDVRLSPDLRDLDRLASFLTP